jgi:hypothetical protein
MSEVAPFAVRDREVTHVIIEIFGGDNNLSPFIVEDMQEMAAGNRGPFAVLALADYADRGGVVVELSPRAGNHVIEELGEINTGDPETLAAFLARALATYGPGVRKAIGFWDHGSGTFDEQDPDQTVLERRLNSLPRYRRGRSRPARRLFVRSARVMANPAARAMLHDDTNGGVLTNLEAEGVLKAAFARAGMAGRKVDLIFSDTCLNGMVEVAEQLKDYAACVVGSEELEPGDGWEYHEWLSRMSDDPPADAERWARQAVEAFGAGYADRPDQHPCTLAAFRSDNRIADAFAGLVAALEARGEEGFAWVLTARSRAQSFTSDKDSSDLKDFALRLAKAAAGDGGVRAAAEAVAAAVDEAAVHSVALGPTVPRATGLAFWCPATAGSLEADVETYARLAFDRRTGWSRYLGARFLAS